MERTDLFTGEPFYPSRITQKFACADNRIKYHNRKANKLRHSIMFINNPLYKNLRILNELMKGKNNGTFHKQFLLGKGYAFDVLTHFENFDGKRTACIYQYAISVGSSDEITFTRIKTKRND
jgi:hypothetical protein